MFQLDSFPGLQALPRLCNPLEETRIVFELAVRRMSMIHDDTFSLDATMPCRGVSAAMHDREHFDTLLVARVHVRLVVAADAVRQA